MARHRRYYLVLVRKLGRLAGWYKSDALRAAELNSAFVTSYSNGFGGMSGGNTRLLLAQFEGLLDFLQQGVPQLLPPEARSAAAISTLRVQYAHLQTSLLPKFQAHLTSDPDYMAIAHSNLNIDNAYWWRDAEGVLDCGLIDWANFQIQEVSGTIDMCLFCAGWGVMKAQQRALLQAFVDEYAAAGGPQLSVDELALRFDMQLALSLPGQAGVPSQLYRRIKKEQWPSVTSITADPRVDGDTQDAFLVRSYLGNVLYRVARWQQDGVYARLCKWAGEPEQRG